MLEKAEERIDRSGWKNIVLIQGDASNLPLAGEIDTVLSTYAMSLVPQYEKP